MGSMNTFSRGTSVCVVLLLALGWSLSAARELPEGRSIRLSRHLLQSPGPLQPCDPDEDADCECEIKDNEISCARVSTSGNSTSASAGASASSSGGPVSSSASVVITSGGGSASSSTSTPAPGGGTEAEASRSPAPEESAPEEPAPEESAPEEPPSAKPEPEAPVKPSPPRPVIVKPSPIVKPTRPVVKKPDGDDLEEICYVNPDAETQSAAHRLVADGVKIIFVDYLEDGLHRIQTFYQTPGTVGSTTIISTTIPDDIAAACDIDPEDGDEELGHVKISHTSSFSSTSTSTSTRGSDVKPRFKSFSTTSITSGGKTTVIKTTPSSDAPGGRITTIRRTGGRR